jgi:hypothetical protein
MSEKDEAREIAERWCCMTDPTTGKVAGMTQASKLAAEIRAYGERQQDEALHSGCTLTEDHPVVRTLRELRGKLEAAEARAEQAEAAIAALKTETGLVAVVMARGWPLPEEHLALQRELDEANLRRSETVAMCENEHARADRYRALLAKCADAMSAASFKIVHEDCDCLGCEIREALRDGEPKS